MATTHPEFNRDTDGSLVAQAFKDQINGKNVLVTGVAPDGIGRTTALNIASQHPSLLIIAGRIKDKLSSVENEIKQLYPAVNVRSLLVDLSSIASVRNAANEVLNYPEPTIDIIINNILWNIFILTLFYFHLDLLLPFYYPHKNDGS
eukprot:TRINITY_DN505_c0_g1_i4.p1 TRINITY_DN505_c0_g1~~TRINITY_DN505_c0_g1_i4.p1  ORF type:complete len:147 (-),score=33.42 TRINITY_DN505_c0_g1_i4:345-785(-)